MKPSASDPEREQEREPGTAEAGDDWTSSSVESEVKGKRDRDIMAPHDKDNGRDNAQDNANANANVSDTMDLSSNDDGETYDGRDDLGIEPVESTPASATGANEAALAQIRTGTSTASRPPDFEVTFAPDDPENPRNWSALYKSWTLSVLSIATWVIVLYSTSYTSSIPGLMEEFGTSSSYTTLGVTTYLLGLATGCLVVAPMSELFGRQRVYVFCTFMTGIMIIPCGLSHSIQGILIARYIGAVFGSALISNCPGTVFDISDDDNRAKYMSFWSMAPMNGPATGPMIGGVVFQYLGWRWCNWIVLIMTGVIWLCMLTLKETYAPMILRAKVMRLQKETDDTRWWCRYDSRMPTAQLFKTYLGRPFVLAATEPILWSFNVWISIVYGILYLCFVAYPIVFAQHRGWEPAVSGLAFTGIGIGTLAATLSEPLMRRLIHAHGIDPKTGRPPPEAVARVMALGAVLTPIGQLCFAWTSLPPSIHWAVPIAFGIPFGMGNTLSFIYAANYLAGAYGIYAASALASNAVIRSAAGGLLPLAGPSMYAAMTPQWAGTFLGLLEVALIPVPFVFWRYGDRIRSKSPIIRHMREDQEKNESRRAKAEARAAEKRAREAEVEAEAEEQEAARTSGEKKVLDEKSIP